MLFRIAKADGQFLGRIGVTPIAGGSGSRAVYLPFDHADGSNPLAPIEEPAPGVFIFRLSTSLLYPNAVHVTDQFTAYITQVTKRTDPQSYGKLGDRPWNEPGPRKIDPDAVAKDSRPTLRAVILDFSAVQNIDVSSTQVLVDVRKQLDRHASPDSVEWHFVNVRSPWTKRALVSAGFGRAASTSRAVFSLSEIGASAGGFGADGRQATHAGEDPRLHDEEIAEAKGQLADPSKGTQGKRLPILSTAYPAFHITIDEALEAVYSALKIGVYPGSANSSLSDVKKQ